MIYDNTMLKWSMINNCSFLEPLESELAKKAVDTIRVLAADVVQKANSGHPG